MSDRHASDWQLRYLNLTTHEGFVNVPDVHQDLINDMALELLALEDHVRGFSIEHAALQDEYQKMLEMARLLAAQSSTAHAALDAQGVPVCSLQVGERVKCLTAKLKEKDDALIACHITLERLAHEAKHRIRQDPQ